MSDLVTGNILGPEFDKGNIQANTIRLKIGSGLAIQPDGTIVAAGTTPSITVTKQPLYQYRDIWAEESGGANANNAEWSFGNGATGFMGLPIDDGWEVVALYFNADTYPAAGTISIDLMDFGNTPSNAVANTIANISLVNSTDGGGTTNNAYKYETLATPIAIPVTGVSTTIGFLTRTATGNISDMRVGAFLRKQVGEYVSDVVLTSSMVQTMPIVPVMQQPKKRNWIQRILNL